MRKDPLAGFQFTRPGGRDKLRFRQLRPSRVSIHAPGWARPQPSVLEACYNAVSIHAPGWARPWATQNLGAAVEVSIHAPGWARPPRWPGTPSPTRVSIHAPGWARPAAAAATSGMVMFQFTRPGGRDYYRVIIVIDEAGVSIHAPGWARLSTTYPFTRIRRFNSRARVGATFMFACVIRDILVSIHAPGWARPSQLLDHHLDAAVSIHAPGWARLSWDRKLKDANGFQFTRPGGRDFRPKT